MPSTSQEHVRMFRHVLCEARIQAPKRDEHQTSSIIDCVCREVRRLKYIDHGHPACGISIIIDSKPVAMIRPPRRNFCVEKEDMSGTTKGRIIL